jgi:hypothetical protein
MAKTAMNQLEDQVELIRHEAYAAGYAAAMQAIREIAARPAPAEKRPTPAAPTPRGRLPRQAQPAPRKAQARQTPADSKPAAKRPERGSNARVVEEVLRALAPQAVRPGEIRAALCATRVCLWPTRRSAMRWDSWKAVKRLGRMGMADGGSRRRKLPDDRGAPGITRNWRKAVKRGSPILNK